MKMRTLTITIPEEWARNLEVLGDTVELVLEKLADHAQQGVYRPGAWERAWTEQAFGPFEDELEPDDAPGRLSADGRVIFQRPKRYDDD
jgi:hypothetical protein